LIQILDSIAELPPYGRVAVTINCSTRWFTTLAVASLSRFSTYPILIIDCASTDNSIEHFCAIFSGKNDNVYLYSHALNLHGYTLDALFEELAAYEVLLVDSDLEILDGKIISAMDAALSAHNSAYGSGLLQEGAWMTAPLHHYPEGVSWYHQRMWIPLTLLRTSEIKNALKRGESFVACRDYCEIVGWPRLSGWLSHRFRLRGLFGVRAGAPALIHEWDTGSKLHNSLICDGLGFAEIDPSYYSCVNHIHGITRSRSSSLLFRLAVSLGLISKSMLSDFEQAERAVRLRLKESYGDYV